MKTLFNLQLKYFNKHAVRFTVAKFQLREFQFVFVSLFHAAVLQPLIEIWSSEGIASVYRAYVCHAMRTVRAKRHLKTTWDDGKRKHVLCTDIGVCVELAVNAVCVSEIHPTECMWKPAHLISGKRKQNSISSYSSTVEWITTEKSSLYVCVTQSVEKHENKTGTESTIHSERNENLWEKKCLTACVYVYNVLLLLNSNSVDLVTSYRLYIDARMRSVWKMIFSFWKFKTTFYCLRRSKQCVLK